MDAPISVLDKTENQDFHFHGVRNDDRDEKTITAVLAEGLPIVKTRGNLIGNLREERCTS